MWQGGSVVQSAVMSNATKKVAGGSGSRSGLRYDLQMFAGKSGSASNYILFNKTHKDSLPKPKGRGPNGGRLQSHHGLQKQWAIDNLSKYGYDPDLAPTVTIETGKGMPHTAISNLQNARRDARIASGKGKWSSSLQDELSYIVSGFRAAGFSDSTINNVLKQQYKMLDKLDVLYERIKY